MFMPFGRLRAGWVCGRLIMAQFGGNTIEMLPHSATFRIEACSGMRKHFVLPIQQASLPFDPAASLSRVFFL